MSAWSYRECESCGAQCCYGVCQPKTSTPPSPAEILPTPSEVRRKLVELTDRERQLLGEIAALLNKSQEFPVTVGANSVNHVRTDRVMAELRRRGWKVAEWGERPGDLRMGLVIDFPDPK